MDVSPRFMAQHWPQTLYMGEETRTDRFIPAIHCTTMTTTYKDNKTTIRERSIFLEINTCENEHREKKEDSVNSEQE